MDYINRSIRESAILTGSYVAGAVLENTRGYNQMVVNIRLTLGNLANALVKVEFSPDGTTYDQETFSSIEGGNSTDTLGYHTLATGGNYNIPIPITTNFIKISVLGTGDVTDSLCAINCDLGVN